VTLPGFQFAFSPHGFFTSGKRLGVDHHPTLTLRVATTPGVVAFQSLRDILCLSDVKRSGLLALKHIDVLHPASHAAGMVGDTGIEPVTSGM
jgi:hypothetical protein